MLTVSCATETKDRKNKQVRSRESNKSCNAVNESLEEKHVTIAARNKARVLSRCFANYMKFEKNKSQNIYSCNLLTIRSNGSVKYVYTRGQSGSTIPKDLKMCIEQELWKMNFKGLQLNREVSIRFPIEFKTNP